MSFIAPLLLMTSVNGMGIYSELGYDVAWNDRIGFVTRGDRVLAEAGYFTGEFQGSYAFGHYWRFGAGLSWEPIILDGARSARGQSADTVFVEQFFYPHLAISHGANLFRIGFMWKLRLGPIWSTTDATVFLDKEVFWGGAVTAEGSINYNFAPSFALGPRLGIGLMIDEIRTGYQVTAGFAATFVIPLNNVRAPEKERADYWEKDY